MSYCVCLLASTAYKALPHWQLGLKREPMHKAATSRAKRSAAVAGMTLLGLLLLPLLAATGVVVYAVMLAGIGLVTLTEVGRALGSKRPFGAG